MQFMKEFPTDALFGIMFHGCTYEMGNFKKKDKKLQFLPVCAQPKSHPMVLLYCRYFKYLQLFWAVELDTGLEVYVPEIVESNCEKTGSAGSVYACVILPAVVLLLNVLSYS